MATDMPLPAGRTCNDCDNFKRWCQLIIGLAGTETECDYSPSEFKLAAPLAPGSPGDQLALGDGGARRWIK